MVLTVSINILWSKFSQRRQPNFKEHPSCCSVVNAQQKLQCECQTTGSFRAGLFNHSVICSLRLSAWSYDNSFPVFFLSKLFYFYCHFSCDEFYLHNVMFCDTLFEHVTHISLAGNICAFGICVSMFYMHTHVQIRSAYIEFERVEKEKFICNR